MSAGYCPHGEPYDDKDPCPADPADTGRVCTFSGEWKMEFVGWCWPDEIYGSVLHFLPNDGGEPPLRDGIRKVYAPVQIDGSVAPE